MIDYEVPERLYHGLTLDRFIEHWQHGKIRGVSRHHLDPEGKRLGTWLSDQFQYPIEHRHGIESTNEILVEADWSDLGLGKITEYKKKTRIIVELASVHNPEDLVPHMLPNQLFYFGDIPTGHISGVHVDQFDDASRNRDIERLIHEGINPAMIAIYDRVAEVSHPYKTQTPFTK